MSAAVGKAGFQCPSARCGSYNCESTNQGVFCADCGAVIEESSFDLSVSFTDNQDGSRSMTGQFVSNMCTTPYRFSGSGGVGFNRESREVTIANGKRRIQQLASALRLDHFVDAAHRLFLSAVQRNFVHGRKTNNVVAACLYIVCRQRNAPHLLIDFSDVLQTNVYVLGNTFLKFRRLLNLELPAIDPVHYIDRFASKLEFAEKTHEVARTAHKLVARMKRDWIQTGRRPSGVCGAALIMAARMNGFHRTQREVVTVMKICEETLRKRLIEFEATPSGSLTVEEFLQIDLPEEANPPSFDRNRRREIAVAKVVDGSQPLALPDADIGSTGLLRRRAPTKAHLQRMQAQQDMYQDLEQELEESLKTLEEQHAEENGSAGGTAKTAEAAKAAAAAAAAAAAGAGLELVPMSAPQTSDGSAETAEPRNAPPEPAEAAAAKEVPAAAAPPEAAAATAPTAAAAAAQATAPAEAAAAEAAATTGSAEAAADGQPPKESAAQQTPSNELAATTTQEEDDALFTDEIECLLLKPEESRIKKVMWQVQNKDYLEKERQDRLDGKVKRKRKRKSRAEREAEQPGSAAEATRNMVESRKMSKKINYDAWSKLFET